MADIAQIGVQFDTTGLRAGKLAMQQLSPAAKTAENAADGLEMQLEQTGAAARNAAAGLTTAAKANGLYVDSAGRLRTATGQFATQADRAKAAAEGMAFGIGKAGDAADVASGKIKRFHNAANDNAGQLKANTSNIAAQFQDIGVTAAMGMSPMLIAFQQGTQLAAIFTDAVRNGSSATGALVSAFGAVVSPVALVTIGIVALVAALIQMVNWTSVAQTVLNYIADVLPKIADYLAIVGVALAVAFAPSIIAGIWSMSVALVSGLLAAIGAVVAAVGIIPLAIVGIITAFYMFRDEIADILGFDLVKIARDTVNWIIGAFVGGYRVIAGAWDKLPAAFSAIGQRIYATFINWIRAMAGEAISIVNGLIQSLNGMMRSGFSFLGGDAMMSPQLPMLPGPSELGLFKREKVGGDAAGEAALGDIKDLFNSAQGVDYVGQGLDYVTNAANSAAGAVRGLAGGLDDVEGGKGKGGGGGQRKTELEKIAEGLQKLGAPYEQASNAVRQAQELLTNGIITNDQYAQSLGRIEAAFMAAGGTAQQWSKIIMDNTDSIAGKLKDLAENALSQLGDAFIDLAVDGKASFGDLARSIVKDLLKIMWQALIVKPLLNWFGGLFGGGGAADPWAGMREATTFATGGAFTNSVVSSPTAFAHASGMGVMGEAGPEGILPLKKGPDGRLGVSAYSTGSGDSSNRGGNVVNVEFINQVPNSEVSRETGTNDRGEAVERFILTTVGNGMANGEFDGASALRYNNRPMRVTR